MLPAARSQSLVNNDCSSLSVNNLMDINTLAGGYCDLYLAGNIVYRIGTYMKEIHGINVHCVDFLSNRGVYLVLTQQRYYPNNITKKRNLFLFKEKIVGIRFSDGTFQKAMQEKDWF